MSYFTRHRWLVTAAFAAFAVFALAFGASAATCTLTCQDPVTPPATTLPAARTMTLDVATSDACTVACNGVAGGAASACIQGHAGSTCTNKVFAAPTAQQQAAQAEQPCELTCEDALPTGQTGAPPTRTVRVEASDDATCTQHCAAPSLACQASPGTTGSTCRSSNYHRPADQNLYSPCVMTCRVPAASGPAQEVTVRAEAANGAACAADCTAHRTCRAGGRSAETTCLSQTYTTPTTPTVEPPPNNFERQTVPLRLSQSIGGTTVVNDLADYIGLLYNFMIGFSAIAAVIMIVYGGFRYLVGSAGGDVQAGKQIVIDAVVGLFLVVAAYAILEIVNPNTLTLRLPVIRAVNDQDIPQAPEASAAENPTIINQFSQQACTEVSQCAACTQALCPSGMTCDTSAGSVQCSEIGQRADGEGVSRRCQYRCINPQATQQVVANDTACSFDSGVEGCGTGKVCLRTGIVVRANGAFDPDGDRTQKLGKCTDGTLNMLCKCSGTGCQLTTQWLSQENNFTRLFPAYTNAEEGRAQLARFLSGAQLATSGNVWDIIFISSRRDEAAQAARDDARRSFLNAVTQNYPTNSGWTGEKACGQGLTCLEVYNRDQANVANPVGTGTWRCLQGAEAELMRQIAGRHNQSQALQNAQDRAGRAQSQPGAQILPGGVAIPQERPGR